MIVGRILGWLFLLAAAAALANDVVTAFEMGVWKMSAAGELWYKLDPGSLNLVQSATQRYVSPRLWDPVIQTILQFYAVPVLALPGFLLLLLFRSREERRRRAKSSQIRAD